MLATQGHFQDRKRSLVERHGVGVAPLHLVVPRQAVERAPQVGMALPARLSMAEAEGAFENWLSLRITLLHMIGARQLVVGAKDPRSMVSRPSPPP